MSADLGARIDLNADVGESFGAWRLGEDEDLYDFGEPGGDKT